MELAFDSKDLRLICENETTAKEKFGAEIAEVLKHRLADLRAATCISDFIVGNPRLSDVGYTDCLVIDLCLGHQIVFKANHPENPLTDNGRLDWEKVRRLKVTHIGSEYE